MLRPISTVRATLAFVRVPQLLCRYELEKKKWALMLCLVDPRAVVGA